MEQSEGQKMIAKVKVGVPSSDINDEQIILPIAIPDLEDVRKLATELHKRRQPYDDTMWGWPVKYLPSAPTPVPDSHMTFTPADFFIGVWPVWWLSFMWENGDDQEPFLSIGDDDLIED